MASHGCELHSASLGQNSWSSRDAGLSGGASHGAALMEQASLRALFLLGKRGKKKKKRKTFTAARLGVGQIE